MLSGTRPSHESLVLMKKVHRQKFLSPTEEIFAMMNKIVATSKNTAPETLKVLYKKKNFI